MPPEAFDAWTDVILVDLASPQRARSSRPRIQWRTLLRLLLLVVLPTALAATYFGVFAASRYVSEARFVVRMPNVSGRLNTAAAASVSDLPKSGGDEDSYAVRDFILSRDALERLGQAIDLRAAAVPAIADPVWRFPGPLNGQSGEDLFDYYKSLVSLDYDSSTNLSTLRVQAFRADDAQRMAGVLITAAESLLNRLDQRARADAIHVANDEVARSRAEALAAQDRMTEFRNREQVIDPLKLSQTVLSTITTLTEQLVETAARLDVAIQASPNSPQIAPLRGRIKALQSQIDQERGVLAGGGASLAPRVAAYERLLLERSFAEQTFVSALTMLETARLDAERQQAYLEQVVAPHVADEPRYPHRVIWVAVTALVGLTVFWLFRPQAPATTRPGLQPA